MTTERQRQAARRQLRMRSWNYECADGEPFSAIAASEDGAFRVLNAERPGMRAEFVGCTEVEAPLKCETCRVEEKRTHCREPA